MDIKGSIETIITQAIESAIENGSLDLGSIPPASIERPKDESNGDWASTVSMRIAKEAKMPPREIAQIIVDNIPANGYILSTEIAGPGFINIILKPDVLQDVVKTIRNEKLDYGKGSIPEGSRKIDLEYISANPTGPMHVGHGRWATLGDSMARIMRHAGYEVTEEFYINDHGNQMNIFANSVVVRYLQQLGHNISMPEQCYGGEYVKDIAMEILGKYGNEFEDMESRQRESIFKDISYKMMLENQRNLLKRYGTEFDIWFSERSLYETAERDSSKIDDALKVMGDKGLVYEKDGAVWFESTRFGDEKDRVLIKKDGEYTYFMSDVAYHWDKIQRGYDKLIDIWGADHHGYIKRCEAMLVAWGYPDRLEVVLGQLVNLYRDGQLVKMSKRTGEMITFEELIDEVGVDATRFLMLSRSSDQQIDFDIDVAKKKDASNPVYYVQYAHARICSILRKAAVKHGIIESEGSDVPIDVLAMELLDGDIELALLTDESEMSILRTMADFKEFIYLAARDRAPFRLTHYSEKIASLFHAFYTNCRVISDEVELERARLALCDAIRIILKLTLSLMGISAPERM